MFVRLNTQRFGARYVSALLIPLLLAGCGGGGGSDNTRGNSVVAGVVVSKNGTAVPGANVTVANASNVATSLQLGDFRLTGVHAGIQTIQANTTVGNVIYTGSTQVLALDNTVSTNAVVFVSPQNQQASITGRVIDNNGNPINQARLFLAPPGGSATTADEVAFADAQGNYSFPNVPNGIAYTVTASVLQFQNSSVGSGSLVPGQHKTINFQLNPSFNQSPLTPILQSATSLTQPSAVLAPSVSAHSSAAQASTNSIYDTIRRLMSPTYARLVANRHAASHIKRLTPHAASNFGPFAIEVDLFFSEASISSVSGYRIYQAVGQNGTLAPYDFLQDPAATVYTDFDPQYVPNQFYSFALSAVNTDSTETGLSLLTDTVQPLDLLNVNQPFQGETLHNPLQVTWQSVQGATAYGVFVYNAYPTLGVSPVAQVSNLSGNTTSYTFPGTFTQGNYWVVVAGSDANKVNVSASQIVHFQLQ